MSCHPTNPNNRAGYNLNKSVRSTLSKGDFCVLLKDKPGFLRHLSSDPCCTDCNESGIAIPLAPICCFS